MDPEGNVDPPRVDMEGQQTAPQIVEIDYPHITQDPSLLQVPDDLDGPTNFSTQATEGPRISTRVMSQPDTYASSMTGKSYEYTMTQLESQGVLHPAA